MKRVAILGATGSIGRSALSLLADRRDAFRACLLTTHTRVDELFEQAALHAPDWLCVTGDTPPTRAGARCFTGEAGLLEALAAARPDAVLNAITGAAGLRASAWALDNGIDLLLANKESLVIAGDLLAASAARSGARILPVDSEHAAIHQCLRGERREDVRRVYLTASGGPFRDLPLDRLAAVSPEAALQHPTWKMGPRITVGSATLMNKAFEVIEAHHLFGLSPVQIEVLIHRQSIVHSMVELRDGSLLAQLGVPDMRVPILYCLGWPERLDFDFRGFDPLRFASLTFEPVDRARFPALALGYAVVRAGGDAGAVLNAADEVATDAFLRGQIVFPRLVESVEEALQEHAPARLESVDQVLETDARVRQRVRSRLETACSPST